MGIQVKICGLSDPDTLRAAVEAGADWVGFVFVEQSPRYVSYAAAADLLQETGDAVPVGLLVNPEDQTLETVTALGLPVLQLHGSETPSRVAEIKAQTGCEVWKAIGISTADDLASMQAYTTVADRLLLDAKPSDSNALKGGTGIAFDWTLLKNETPPLPWLLAGGLTAETVAAAVHATGARAVDVSSGVERARGVKDAALIQRFINAVRSIEYE